MTIFIVGANGLLGRRITEAMRTRWPLRTVSSRPTSPLCLRFDLRAPDNFEYRVVSAGDKIVFVSGISSPDQCEKQFDLAYSINVTGTIKAIENFVVRGAQIIFMSSDVIFGETTREVFEDSDRRPVGAYAEMKADVERRFESVPQVKVLRLSYVVCGDDKFLCYLRSCLQSRAIASVFPFLARRVVAAADVTDAVEAICQDWHVLRYHSLNVGGPELLSRRQLADIYAQATGGRLRVETAEPPAGFFDARPRVINMGSRYLEAVLDRKPATVASTLAVLASTPTFEGRSDNNERS